MLRSQGRTQEAIDVFRRACDEHTDRPELPANLGTALTEQGEYEDAELAFERALQIDGAFAPALAGMGSLMMRLGRFDAARPQYERLLVVDPQSVAGRMAMYELEQIAGNVKAAIEHQRRALERQALFSEHAPQEERRILVLLAPGDWQANVPVDFLIDRRTTTLHKLYLTQHGERATLSIPKADVVFTAIGESDENAPALREAAQIVAQCGLPSINDPARILLTNRVQLFLAMQNEPGVRVPQTLCVSRQDMLAARPGLPFPIVARPVGSQAGRGLEKIDDAAQLAAYAGAQDASSFYIMPFVDFSYADGFFRKYRIIVVDGEPYPYHLAVSPRWMIHYYNAPMREFAWMREEEARFLSSFDTVFTPRLQQALRRLAQILQLGYFGVDCSIDREGRLLVFEADPAMIVHAGDDPEIFGYKHDYARRIFSAFERLVDRARSG